MTRLYCVLSLTIVLAATTPLRAESVEGKLFSQLGDTLSETELIFVHAQTRETRTVSTGKDGSFGVQLPPGEYDVYREDSGQRTFLGRVQVENQNVAVVNLQLPENDNSSLDRIRDFKIGVNQTSGSFSQSLDAVVNPFPARKQGRLYGSLYEFHRNDNFDARNFFDPFGEPLPEYKRNQFGVTLGLFVFPEMVLQGSYDGLRINQGSTLLSHVPTPAMKTGDFRELGKEIRDPLTGQPFSGNRIPESRISPQAKSMLSSIPDPNRVDPDRNFVNNDPLVRNQDYLAVRFDYELNNNSKLLVDYHFTDAERDRVHPLPAFNYDRLDRDHSASVSYNRALSARLISYARIEFGRSENFRLSRNTGNEGLLKSLGISGIAVEDPIEEGYPEFVLTDYTNFGDRQSPNTSVRNRLSVETSFTYALEAHSFRAGVEIGGRQLNNYRSDGLHRGRFVFNGTYTGDAFADFLLGYPDTAYRGIGVDRADLRRKRWQFFLRDQWRVTQNLDFTIGMSYRYVQPYYSVHDNVSGFYPLLFEPSLDGEIVIAGTERATELGFGGAVKGSLVFPDRNDWSPQLGFSLNLFGSNRLVLRGTYSIWYDSPDDWYSVRSLSRNYPFYYTESVESSSAHPEIDLANPFEGETQPELTMRGIEPHIRSMNVQFWRLAIENEIARNWNLEIQYVGRKGTGSNRLIPGNVPEPGPEPLQSRRPNPEYGTFFIVTDGASFTGHALDLAAEKRLSSGFSLRSGFEWNRFLGDNFYGDPSNPRNLKAERAPVSWVPRKRFFVNYIIDLPFHKVGQFAETSGWVGRVFDGWRLSGITEIRNGRYFSVTTPGDPNNDGVYGDRPNRIGPGVADSSSRSIDRWFATEDFTAAPEYGFGDSGRNILLGPGYQAWDVSVIKQTRLSDGDLLEFRVEFFNAFNNVNFDNPNSEFGTSLFGKVFGAARAREIELALKYSF
jgi:hypothetical protein